MVDTSSSPPCWEEEVVVAIPKGGRQDLYYTFMQPLQSQAVPHKRWLLKHWQYFFTHFDLVHLQPVSPNTFFSLCSLIASSRNNFLFRLPKRLFDTPLLWQSWHVQLSPQTTPSLKHLQYIMVHPEFRHTQGLASTGRSLE